VKGRRMGRRRRRRRRRRKKVSFREPERNGSESGLGG
jgi:hypothetical protein